MDKIKKIAVDDEEYTVLTQWYLACKSDCDRKVKKGQCDPETVKVCKILLEKIGKFKE